MNTNSELFKVYNTSAQLHEIYNIIEEMDGELTPEIELSLNIRKENLIEQSKTILDLKNIIDSQVDSLKKEIERLSELKKWREKQIKNIEAALLYITKEYGERDKKGVYKLDLTTHILSTRRSQTTEIEEDGLGKLHNSLVNYTTFLKLNNEQFEKVKAAFIDLGIDSTFEIVPDKTKIKEAILSDTNNMEGESLLKETLYSDNVQGAYIKNKLNLQIK